MGGGDDDTDESLARIVRALAHAPDASAQVVVVRNGTIRVAVDELAAHPPDAIGGFEITGVIGAGGMGVVFEGVDKTLKRRVAIKVLQARRSSPEGSARLLREAQALAQLAHPNVVVVYHAGRESDRAYLVMERITGTNARAWRDAAPRTLAAILDVYRQAAAGLAAAHRAGLVHRDVKPENILVGDDGRVRVTDFGLVAGLDELHAGPIEVELDRATGTLTETGTILGTIPYIAPEAHDGHSPTARADQFALCVALWEAIAGERPHAGDNPAETLAAIRAGTITRGADRLPARVRIPLERGLATDPAARWSSLDALFEAIDADGNTKIPVARTNRRRSPRVAIALGATGVAAAAAAIVLGSRTSPADPPPPPPVPERVATPGTCPYMPVFVGSTILYDDGNGAIFRADRSTPLVPFTGTNRWRANRGRTSGEAVIVSGERGAYLDVERGTLEPIAVESSSFAVGGATLFYDRTDVAEVRRVRDGDDAPAVTLPDGRWPYTVAASADGAHLAITTALDRSAPTICLADLDARGLARGAPTCLDRDDVIAGRAAFSPDGGTVYYQTGKGIRRRVLATGGDDMFLPEVYAYGGVDVSPDGRALVFSDSHPADTELLPVGPNAVPALRGKIANALALPDKGWVYVRHEAGVPDSIVVQRGGTSRVIAGNLGVVMLYGVDKTGRRAVFDLDGDAPGIHVVDLDGFPPVRLTTTAADSNPIFTADGRVAFTRWDTKGQPAVLIVDPAAGTRGDAERKPSNPLPRITASLIPTTGELVLMSLDNKHLFAWDPATDKERELDLAGYSRPILQAVAAPDGRALAVLDDQSTTWIVPLDGAGAAYVAAEPVPCATSDRPVFDAAGHLVVTSRPWRGGLYRVPL